MKVVAVDTETHRIGPGEVVPKLVCVQAASRDDEGEIEVQVRGSGDDDQLLLIETLIRDDSILLVFLNAGYDLAVIARAYPHLIPDIWRMLARVDRVTDVGVREKLMNLSTTGQLSVLELPDGSHMNLLYSMEALAERRLGIDLSADKDQSDDNWRLNYAMLDGMPFADYPADAARYATEDAIHTLQIYESQAEQIGDRTQGPGSAHGEFFKTSLSFALQIITARGMAIDPVERERLEQWVARELTSDKLSLLYETGILRRSLPRRPFARSHKKTAEALGIDPEAARTKTQWTDEELEIVEQAGVKISAGKAPSVDTKKLHAHVEELCEKLGTPVVRTDPSGKFPEGQVSTNDKVVNTLAPNCPVMAQYQHRQGLQQIANTELPRMQAPFVHFKFDPVKSTFRTGSSGGKKGTQLYPATNGQNINPEVRKAYVARPGKVLCSADYDRLELCTLGQKCYELFGHSVLRDMINQGVDVHAYLGSQIALKMHSDFSSAMVEAGISEDPMKVYEAFSRFKQSDKVELKEIYAKFRKLAKPTGLGYPGGLGFARFVEFASGKPYFLNVDTGTAKLLKQIWFDTYPEMREYFNWVNTNCEDPLHPPRMVMDSQGNPLRDESDGSFVTKKLYCFTTPLGHYRSAAAYTDAANGAGLQAFAADGFCIAIFNAVRACHDPEFGSVLYGSHILDEIHDELIGEWDDDELSHARAMELKEIMELSMRQVVTDTRISVEPVLMRRWNKWAEPAYADGKLVVWEEPSDAES